MDFRLTTAISLGKLISFVIKFIGGGATAAPGLLALKIDRRLVSKLSKKIKKGAIIITGTNGKTTTARLVFDVLSPKSNIIHNRQGSNLLRGIASTLISQTSIFGKIEKSWALWEVDEATLPEAIKNTRPGIVLILNLFRDQLDRYGEVDSIRRKWQKAVSSLPKNSTLILNADDPNVSILSRAFHGKVVYFGVAEKKINLPQVIHVADVRYCLDCGSKLIYKAITSSHMGHYRCSSCKLKRPTPQISASKLTFSSDFSTSVNVGIDGETIKLTYPLPGLFNVYNILATVCVAKVLEISPVDLKERVTKFSAAFGRFQRIQIGNKNILLFLIKNPTGANEVLRTLANRGNLNLLIALNDKVADGRDVSWIWDVNWEILKSQTQKVVVSGIRAWDIATRLKYASFKLSKNSIHENIFYSIKYSLSLMNNKDTLIVLPTYTALISVQGALNKLGESTKWQEQ